MFEPLRITAYPRTGIQTDAFLPLDGILFAEAMRHLHGPQLLTMPGRIPNVEAAPLPLARHELHGEWFYAASFACWGPHADYQAFWVKRFDRQHEELVDFGGRRGKVIVEQGRYKGYHMPVFLRHALWVSWYVVGDPETLRDLLATVTHVGKKAVQGDGRIIRWQVDPWPHDWSVYGDDDRLMRAIPAPGAGVLYGIRPGYWLPENQIECLMPTLHRVGY